MKKSQVQRTRDAKMQTICWMFGYTRLDMIRNVVIRDKGGMKSIEEKMRKVRLR